LWPPPPPPPPPHLLLAPHADETCQRGAADLFGRGGGEAVGGDVDVFGHAAVGREGLLRVDLCVEGGVDE
jgi:hypothetical protein